LGYTKFSHHPGNQCSRVATCEIKLKLENLIVGEPLQSRQHGHTHPDLFQGSTRSSADAEGLLDAPPIRNITLEKACNGGITCNDTQGYYSCCCLCVCLSVGSRALLSSKRPLLSLCVPVCLFVCLFVRRPRPFTHFRLTDLDETW